MALNHVSLSSPVTSNQAGQHENLKTVVARHAASHFDKPIAAHTRQAFTNLQQAVNLATQDILLDSGCGTANSSLILAREFPRHLVLGVDKSLHRLSKAQRAQAPNLHLVRADLIDFWRLIESAKFNIERHYIFYPNPWPKSKHLQRRWHGHPIFPSMLGLSAILELRTNWKIYADEFAASIEYLLNEGFIDGNIECKRFRPSVPISAFEEKYVASGHELYQVIFERQKT